MAAATLIARLALAAVFAVAGAAKLADRQDARRTLRGFQVPERLVVALAILLPAAELSGACLLLPSATAAYGAACTLALLAAFSTAIAVALARGRRVDCGCFGRWYSAMVSWRTLARNGVLVALAVLVLVGPAQPGWQAAAIAAGVALAGLTVGHVVFSWQLLRQNGRLWRRLAELERRLHVEVPT